ncbi:hypothetical protein V2I01_04935 [Micromonospora sp. BRA006-A]|nr:hypothetical protein [Micromonospora sp. BRA006-A]
MAVDIRLPEGQFASDALAALLSVVAAVNGRTVKDELDQWTQQSQRSVSSVERYLAER